MAKKYYQVVMTAVKSFYVEAESEDDALNHPAVEYERDPWQSGDFDWEYDDSNAYEASPADLESIKRNPGLVAKEDEE